MSFRRFAQLVEDMLAGKVSVEVKKIPASEKAIHLLDELRLFILQKQTLTESDYETLRKIESTISELAVGEILSGVRSDLQSQVSM